MTDDSLVTFEHLPDSLPLGNVDPHWCPPCPPGWMGPPDDLAPLIGINDQPAPDWWEPDPSDVFGSMGLLVLQIVFFCLVWKALKAWEARR